MSRLRDSINDLVNDLHKSNLINKKTLKALTKKILKK